MDSKTVENAGGRYWDRTSDPCDVKKEPSPETRANPRTAAHDDRHSCSLRSPNSWADPGREWEGRAMAWLDRIETRREVEHSRIVELHWAVRKNVSVKQ